MDNPADTVEVTHQELLRLIDRNAPVEQVCTGFRFSEGPIWNPNEQCLYFSDMPGDIRRRWSAREGVVEVRNPSNKCNGMTYDGAGNLYVCEHVTSSLVMETATGERKVLASALAGQGAEQPERRRRAIGRHGLLHRSDVRTHARVRARAEAGAGFPGRVPRRSGRHARARSTTTSASRTDYACRLAREFFTSTTRHARTSERSTSPPTGRSATTASSPNTSAPGTTTKASWMA